MWETLDYYAKRLRITCVASVVTFNQIFLVLSTLKIAFISPRCTRNLFEVDGKPLQNP